MPKNIQSGSFSDSVYQVIRANVGGMTTDELMANQTLHMGNTWEAKLALDSLLEAGLIVVIDGRYSAAIPV